MAGSKAGSKAKKSPPVPVVESSDKDFAATANSLVAKFIDRMPEIDSPRRADWDRVAQGILHNLRTASYPFARKETQ